MPLDILMARQFFADFFYGEHHLPGKIKKCGDGWCIAVRGELATTDYNEMTRLVFMAHARSIRVTVKPLNFKHLLLAIHQRNPESDNITLGHPGLGEALANHAQWNATHQYPINPNCWDAVQLPKIIPVTLVDLAGQEVKRFDSRAACAEWLGTTRGAVTNALHREGVLLRKYRIKITVNHANPA